MSCNGEQVTDTECEFVCKPGFNLTGSAVRTCLPNHTWSGMETTCPLLLCTPLTTVYKEDNSVFVLSPCSNTYNYTCGVGCREGYYIANETDEWKQTCDLFANNYIVNWTEPITCIGKNATLSIISITLLLFQRLYLALLILVCLVYAMQMMVLATVLVYYVVVTDVR